MEGKLLVFFFVKSARMPYLLQIHLLNWFNYLQSVCVMFCGTKSENSASIFTLRKEFSGKKTIFFWLVARHVTERGSSWSSMFGGNIEVNVIPLPLSQLSQCLFMVVSSS